MPNLETANSAEAKVAGRRPARGEASPGRSEKVVQGEVVSWARGHKRWAWSKQRRDAFKLALRGATMTEVAKQVGVHRHTVENWSRRPEWRAEMHAALEEAQVSTKLRRLKMTTVLTDKLGAHSLRELQTENIDTKKAGLVLREHLDYVRAERELFGEGDRPRADRRPLNVVNITLGTGGIEPVEEARRQAAATAFKEFMESYDPKLAVAPRRPDEAAGLLTENVTTDE